MVTQVNKKSSPNTKIDFPLFSSDWWKHFATDRTEHFNSHSVVRNGLSKTEVAEFRTLVNTVLRDISIDKNKLNDTRVWTEGERIKDAFTFFEKNPIDQEIEEWGAKTFGDQKYGMFINYANSHNEELAQKIHSYIQPYIEQFGIPMKGFSTTIILGNYGWTPLGVHNDEKGEYILHFHLGPGEKDMYIWDRQIANSLGYKEKVKVENMEDYLENYEHKISFNTGDLFSMPGKCVHIGNTKEFSIGVVLEFNGLTKKEFAKRLWFGLGGLLFNKIYRGKEASILPAYRPERHKEFVEYLMKGIRHYNIDVRKNLSVALKSVYENHKYRILSNGGFSLISLPHQEKKELSDIKPEQSIIVNAPFKMLYAQEEEKINVFLRGRKMSVNFHEDIPKLIDLINKGNPLSIEAITEQYFQDWTNKDPLYQLLLLFNNYRGINLLD